MPVAVNSKRKNDEKPTKATKAAKARRTHQTEPEVVAVAETQESQIQSSLGSSTQAMSPGSSVAGPLFPGGPGGAPAGMDSGGEEEGQEQELSIPEGHFFLGMYRDDMRILHTVHTIFSIF